MSKWRPAGEQISITGTGLSVEAAFANAPEGMIGIRTLKGSSFPKGQLLVFAASKDQTELWVQDAEMNGDILVVSADGFDEAVRTSDSPYWTLSLGQVTENGVLRCRMQSAGAAKRMSGLNDYFHDCRDLAGDAVGRFVRDGEVWEVYPVQMDGSGQLQLQPGPVEKRYIRAAACSVSEIRHTEDSKVRITVICPDTIEMPEGLSFFRLDGGSSTEPYIAEVTPSGDYSETHSVTGEIDFGRFSLSSGMWQVSCVIGFEEGVPLHVPLYINNSGTAEALAAGFGDHAVCISEDGKKYCINTDLRRRLLLCVGTSPASGILLPEEDTEKAYQNILSRVDRDPDAVSCYAVSEDGSGWIWKLRLPGTELSETDRTGILLVNTLNKQHIFCDAVAEGNPDENGFAVSADLTPLKESVENCLQALWRVYIVIRNGRNFRIMPIVDPARVSTDSRKKKTRFEDARDRFEDCIGIMEFSGRTVEATPLCTYRGEWQIQVADQCMRYHQAIKCSGTDVRLRSGILHIEAECPRIEGAEYTGVVITYLYQLERDRTDYYFPLDSLREHDDSFTASADIRLKDRTFPPIRWEIRIVMKKEGQEYWLRISEPGKASGKKKAKISLRSAARDLLTDKVQRIDSGNEMMLHLTMGGNYALFVQKASPYSGFRFRLKERVAMAVYALMKKQLLSKGIYLVYEKFCTMAQDNGFYFFKYCMDSDMESVMNRHIYYVIDKKAKDYDNLRPYADHVIQFMSLRHMIYILAARLLISSDSKLHSYAWRAADSVIRPMILENKRNVFLQHGVIGLKRVSFQSTGTGGASLFIASNEMEKGFIVQDQGYRPDQVIVTGLSRWDVLEDRSALADKKRILIMPTWRSWLEETNDDIFLESEYFRKYMELINSPWLADYLERHDVYLDFYIHPKLREHIGKFSVSGDRVRLIPFGAEQLNYLMMDCRMLITDYSSVCWDVYYQGKPVIFYQFDLPQYNETQGSYMDLEKDLFGDRAETQEELFRLMEEAADNDFALKPEYAEMRESMYGYIDHNNSRRVCEEIMKRGW